MKKSNSVKYSSLREGDLIYKKFLDDGTDKFYKNQFLDAIDSLNKAIRLGCNDRFAFWRRGCAKARLGDHKGAHIDLVQFVYHLETEYMIKLISDRISERTRFSEDFIELIVYSLNPQELKFIVKRFGLNDGISRTQKEIGIFLGISSQRVSQIKSKAYKKIRLAESLANLFVE